MIKYIRNQKGVSIIEILVVVAIIAIVVGMILPSYFRLKPTIRINGAARQIMGDLMWAKMKAVSENNNYVVVFGEAGPDLTNNTYTIYDDNENDFDSANIDASESVKKAVIPNQNKDVGFGFATGAKETDNVTSLTGDAVKFGITGTPSRPIWFEFRPFGRSNLPGAIYLILDEDLAENANGRMRAITVTTTGRVKIWKYSGSSWE